MSFMDNLRDAVKRSSETLNSRVDAEEARNSSLRPGGADARPVEAPEPARLTAPAQQTQTLRTAPAIYRVPDPAPGMPTQAAPQFTVGSTSYAGQGAPAAPQSPTKFNVGSVNYAGQGAATPSGAFSGGQVPLRDTSFHSQRVTFGGQPVSLAEGGAFKAEPPKPEPKTSMLRKGIGALGGIVSGATAAKEAMAGNYGGAVDAATLGASFAAHPVLGPLVTGGAQYLRDRGMTFLADRAANSSIAAPEMQKLGNDPQAMAALRARVGGGGGGEIPPADSTGPLAVPDPRRDSTVPVAAAVAPVVAAAPAPAPVQQNLRAPVDPRAIDNSQIPLLPGQGVFRRTGGEAQTIDTGAPVAPTSFVDARTADRLRGFDGGGASRQYHIDRDPTNPFALMMDSIGMGQRLRAEAADQAAGERAKDRNVTLRGQDVNVRGQDVNADVTRRGQDVSARNTDVQADVTREGQGVTRELGLGQLRNQSTQLEQTGRFQTGQLANDSERNKILADDLANRRRVEEAAAASTATTAANSARAAREKTIRDDVFQRMFVGPDGKANQQEAEEFTRGMERTLGNFVDKDGKQVRQIGDLSNRDVQDFRLLHEIKKKVTAQRPQPLFGGGVQVDSGNLLDYHPVAIRNGKIILRSGEEVDGKLLSESTGLFGWGPRKINADIDDMIRRAAATEKKMKENK